MKTPILLYATFILCCSTQAQPTFEKYYLGVGTSTLALSEQSSGNLFTGIAYQSGNSIMDPLGNIIHTHCYDLIPFTVLQSVRKYTDNVFYFSAGLVVDSCITGQSAGVDPVIGKMDSLGNILAMHHYQLNAGTCYNGAWDLDVLSDGGAIAWGRPHESFFVLRVDPTGAPVWSKQFPHQGYFNFIRELPGGDFLAGINTDTADAVVARLDASGNFIWCKSYIRPNGAIRDCIIESDTSFVVMGFVDNNTPPSPPPGYHPKMFMMKLSGSGDIQWCKGYSHSSYLWDGALKMAKLSDGNYAALGTLAGRPLLMKTDQNGDTLWTRSAGVNGIAYGTVNLMAATDGGIYYDGGAFGDWGDGAGGVFLFKTDSLGHLPCSEAQAPPLSVSVLFPTDSSFVLTSVEGATAFPSTVADTNYPAVITYDGCTITSVQDPVHQHGIKPSIHPNPSTGHFTLEFPDPLTVDSFYSVYDATGRLLFQRPLSKSMEKVEIDLSGYGKGMYLIRFSDRDGVCAERVVVE